MQKVLNCVNQQYFLPKLVNTFTEKKYLCITVLRIRRYFYLRRTSVHLKVDKRKFGITAHKKRLF